MVPRPRFSTRLRERFASRVTTIVAPAGAGKTTLLTLAVADNHLDPVGLDLWLPLRSSDRDPMRLSRALAEVVGRDATVDVEDNLAWFVDGVWSAAPKEVCLILDDVHRLVGSEAASVVDRLCEELPDNGHLLLAGRQLPTGGIARWRALYTVSEIDAVDLELDDSELAELASLRGATDAGDLPRLAALADLSVRAGHRSGIDYLWSEVLDGLEPERLRALVDVSAFDVVDGAVVELLTGGRYTSDELFEGLPLVETEPSGNRRLHSLFRDALATRRSEVRRREVCALVGANLIERGELAGATVAFAAGGARDSAIQAALGFARQPNNYRSFDEMAMVRDAIVQMDPTSLMARFLEIDALTGGPVATVSLQVQATELGRIADQARAGGQVGLEALALVRMLQVLVLDGVTPDDAPIERLRLLGGADHFAAQMIRLVDAEAAMWRAEPEQSLACLAPMDGADPLIELLMRTFHLISLGRSELVGLGYEATGLEQLPPGVDTSFALAMWLRGDFAPELAHTIGRQLADRAVARRVTHTSVGALGTTACIAITAGDLDAAFGDIAAARRIAGAGCAQQIFAFIDIAEALARCARDGDEAGRDAIAAMLEREPIKHWPTRAYHLGLATIYLLAPPVRPALDRCRFGPTLSMALDAARALLVLRDTGDGAPAAALAWSSLAALRVHVLPRHLLELAVGAAAAGSAEAAAAIGQIPGHHALLHRLATADAPHAPAALTAVAALPARPSYGVSLHVLGALDLRRDGVPAREQHWTRRRVRELAAMLAIHGRVSRSVAAESLWPNLGADKAQANLRVTLSYLQQVIEPDRRDRAEAFFIRVDGEHLVLSGEVDVDLHVLERRLTRAGELDRQGSTVLALEEYRTALGVLDGPPLADLPMEWADGTRARIGSAVFDGWCRVGELELARGEPEQAESCARSAVALDPLSERAVRLLARARSAVGDRSGAVRLLQETSDRLLSEGLVPEADTRALLARLTG